MADDLEALKSRLVIGHKRDGRSRYDEQAKAELVALCERPGASVSRLARECGINANQLSRWLREKVQGGRRPPGRPAAPSAATFLELPLTRPPMRAGMDAGMRLHVHTRLPNGVALELRGIEPQHLGDLIETLGRLRCSASTKT